MNAPLKSKDFYGIELDVDVRPLIALGVPLCSDANCPSYDGKRCRVTGFRPSRHCEPAVEAMAEKLGYRDKYVNVDEFA